MWPSFLELRGCVLADYTFGCLLCLACSWWFTAWLWLKSSVGRVPWCAGCTLALCWSALPGLCLTASCPAWCGTPGEVAKTDVYYPCVTKRDPAHAEMWLFQDENSAARLGKELYLLYLPPFLPPNMILFFISLLLFFVKSKVEQWELCIKKWAQSIFFTICWYWKESSSIYL